MLGSWTGVGCRWNPTMCLENCRKPITTRNSRGFGRRQPRLANQCQPIHRRCVRRRLRPVFHTEGLSGLRTMDGEKPSTVLTSPPTQRLSDDGPARSICPLHSTGCSATANPDLADPGPAKEARETRTEQGPRGSHHARHFRDAKSPDSVLPRYLRRFKLAQRTCEWGVIDNCPVSLPTTSDLTVRMTCVHTNKHPR